MGGRSGGWIRRSERASGAGGPIWPIRPFEKRPFLFWPKIQLGLLKIRLYAVWPNLTLAFRVLAFRYKPHFSGHVRIN